MNMQNLNRPGRALAAAAAVALSAVCAVPQAVSAPSDDDAVTCSARTLRGVYRFHASGFAIVNGAAVPKAIIETLIFDGRGNVLTPQVSLSFNGTIIQPPQGAPGVYTVDANCTGKLAFSDAGAVTFDLHVNPYGKTVHMLQTNANTVMEGTAEREWSLAQWGG